MNRERMLAAIELMKNAKSLDMTTWQTCVNSGKYAKSVKELHTCGNTACFGGYLAVSPEWKKAGGTQVNGWPEFQGMDDEYAVAAYLDISVDTAYSLVFGRCRGDYSEYYEKEWSVVNKDDVIAKLEQIMASEEIYDE